MRAECNQCRGSIRGNYQSIFLSSSSSLSSIHVCVISGLVPAISQRLSWTLPISASLICALISRIWTVNDFHCLRFFVSVFLSFSCRFPFLCSFLISGFYISHNRLFLKFIFLFYQLAVVAPFCRVVNIAILYCNTQYCQYRFQYCQSIAILFEIYICIANTFFTQYWYWYCQYFVKVLLTTLPFWQHRTDGWFND